MSAELKSKSRPLIESQLRCAVIDVSVDSPNHGVIQLTSAEMPLSLMSDSVLRLLHATRANGSATGVTPESGDSASMIGAVPPRHAVAAAGAPVHEAIALALGPINADRGVFPDRGVQRARHAKRVVVADGDLTFDRGAVMRAAGDHVDHAGRGVLSQHGDLWGIAQL